MGLPQSCCCCCSLQTGGFVLGWLGIIISVIHLALIAVGMANSKNIYVDGYGNINSALVYVLIIFIINFLIYIFLVVGANSKKHVLLMPWLIVKMIEILGITILVIILTVIFFAHGATLYGIITLSVGLLITGLLFYWWLCIASLYKNIRQEADASGGFRGVVYHPGTHVQHGLGIPPSYDQIAQKV